MSCIKKGRWFTQSGLAALLLLTFCRKQATDSQPLLPIPIFISSPADTLVIERGIDAVPDLNAIQVDWQIMPEYKGYELFRRSVDETKFSLLHSFSEKDSSYLDQSAILTNKWYYYYIRAYDKKQNRTPPSDTLDYMLLDKAFNLSVSLKDPVIFHWQVQEILSPFYVLKLFDDTSGEKIWFSRISSSYQGFEEQAVYNWDGKAELLQLIPNRGYRWRVDIVGPEIRSGSESAWHKFKMPQVGDL